MDIHWYSALVGLLAAGAFVTWLNGQRVLAESGDVPREDRRTE